MQEKNSSECDYFVVKSVSREQTGNSTIIALRWSAGEDLIKH